MKIFHQEVHSLDSPVVFASPDEFMTDRQSSHDAQVLSLSGPEVPKDNRLTSSASEAGSIDSSDDRCIARFLHPRRG